MVRKTCAWQTIYIWSWCSDFMSWWYNHNGLKLYIYSLHITQHPSISRNCTFGDQFSIVSTAVLSFVLTRVFKGQPTFVLPAWLLYLTFCNWNITRIIPSEKQALFTFFFPLLIIGIPISFKNVSSRQKAVIIICILECQDFQRSYTCGRSPAAIYVDGDVIRCTHTSNSRPKGLIQPAFIKL